MLNRRTFFARAAGLATLGLAGHHLELAALTDAGPTITIYKSKTCGCCAKWVDHIKAAGFKTVVHDRDNMDEVKDWLGVPADLRSCHTSQVGSYVIEGHVPASDIKKVLDKKLKLAGLAAPGMPGSSPGMAVPGEPTEPYEVLSFQRDGKSKLFTKH